MAATTWVFSSGSEGCSSISTMSPVRVTAVFFGEIGGSGSDSDSGSDSIAVPANSKPSEKVIASTGGAGGAGGAFFLNIADQRDGGVCCSGVGSAGLGGSGRRGEPHCQQVNSGSMQSASQFGH